MFVFYRATGIPADSSLNTAHSNRCLYRCVRHARLPGIISTLMFLICILPATAVAENCRPETQATKTATEAETATTQATQRAVINPATGQLDSKASMPQRDFQALADARTLLRQNIIVMNHPDGSKSADVGEAYMTTLEARIVDGELVTCHQRRWATE